MEKERCFFCGETKGLRGYPEKPYNKKVCKRCYDDLLSGEL